jgi:hypothetical protein
MAFCLSPLWGLDIERKFIYSVHSNLPFFPFRVVYFTDVVTVYLVMANSVNEFEVFPFLILMISVLMVDFRIQCSGNFGLHP